MLDGFGSLAPHVAANPQTDNDCPLDGNELEPVVVMFPETGEGLLGTRAKQMRDDAPAVPDPVGPVVPVGPVTPAYPAERMLAVVQLIVLVASASVASKLTDAAQSVKPALGAAVMEVDHPAGTGLMLPVDHV